MQGAGGDAELAQRGDLVVHQRDQRRHDDRGAGQAERRDLVAQALAAAGGHQHQGVAAADHVAHHLFLQAAEPRKAEDPAHHRLGLGQQRVRRTVHAQGPPMTIPTRRLSWLVRAKPVAPSASIPMRPASTPSATSWSTTTWARVSDR